MIHGSYSDYVNCFHKSFLILFHSTGKLITAIRFSGQADVAGFGATCSDPK